MFASRHGSSSRPPFALVAPLLAVGCCLFGLLSLGDVKAQEAEKLSANFIPDDAVAAIYLSPNEMLNSPDWRLAPTEVIRAAGLEYIGLDPYTIEDATVVVGFPGPQGPKFGASLSLNQPFSLDDLSETLAKEFEANQVDGMTVMQSRRPPIINIHQPDPKQIVISTGGYLSPMMAATGTGSGQLPTLASRITKRPGVSAIIVMDQLRPIATGMLQQQVNRMPPQLRGLANVAELTDAIMINATTGLTNSSVSLSMLAKNEAAAKTLLGTINDSIGFAKTMMQEQLTREIRDQGPVADAMRQYIRRLGEETNQLIVPIQQGKVVRVGFSNDVGGIATVGVLTGLLLPAVQAARTASRRMADSNQMKQIGLAMHNHHSAFKKLPDRAIRDSSGKPLLSWRVKILPFIEQQALYEQFHLDEPWDSPHNIKLLDQMPDTYAVPGLVSVGGKTVYQVPVNDKCIFRTEAGDPKFREVTDGLSNTIMVLQTNPSAAVPWTKPADLEVDLNQPLRNLGRTHRNGFHVLMGDGAVRFFTSTIDSDLFGKLLTRAGGEVIPGGMR